MGPKSSPPQRSLFLLGFLLFYSAVFGFCEESIEVTIEIEVESVDYSTGLVRVLVSGEAVVPGDILEARTDVGVLEALVLDAEGDRVRAISEDVDAVSLLEPGDILPGRVVRPGETPGLSPRASDLVRELSGFEADLSGLIEESTMEEGGTRLPAQRGWGGWRGDTGIRVGYDRYSRSGVVITDLDPTDRESVEKALADLDALILRAREVPGINQSDLDRAREFADQARAILANPSGDLEEAAANIIAGQILVEAAVDRAGRDPDTVRVEQYQEETEDTTEGYGFLNLRKDFPWGAGGNVSVYEHLEGGTRFLGEGFDVRAERRPARWLRSRLESSTDLRLYRSDFTDNFVNQRVDAGLGFDPARRWSVDLEAEYILRKEFDTSSDDGSQFLSPGVESVYRFSAAGRLRAFYRPSRRRYNDDLNRDLDYDQDRFGLGYEYGSRAGFLNLRWEEIRRDADRPLDEDDYTEDFVSAYGLLNWSRSTGAGLEVSYLDREYTTTGPVDPDTGMKRGEDNTDFHQWSVRPFVEIRVSRDFRASAAYRYSRLTNRDRVPHDDINKSMGDFDLHRVELSLQWTIGSRWEVFLQPGFEHRHYLNGETGKFETWFADFHNLADYDAFNAGLLAVYHATESLDVELEAFHARDRHPTYDELDTDQTTIQGVVRYLF